MHEDDEYMDLLVRELTMVSKDEEDVYPMQMLADEAQALITDLRDKVEQLETYIKRLP